MSSNEVWLTCGDCGTELKQNDKQCPKCGSNKICFHQPVGGHTLHPHGGLRARKKLKGLNKFVKIIVSRWKRSRDPRLKGCVGEEVNEDMTIDKEKNWKDHVVKDAKTGEIIHEEHEKLSKHKKGSLNTMNQQPRNTNQSVSVKVTAKNYAALALGLLATAFGLAWPYFEMYPRIKILFWILLGLAILSIVFATLLRRYAEHPDFFNTKRRRQLVNLLFPASIEYTLFFLGFVGLGVSFMRIGTIGFLVAGIITLALGYALLIKGVYKNMKKRQKTSRNAD